jgi:hypothetical protein
MTRLNSKDKAATIQVQQHQQEVLHLLQCGDGGSINECFQSAVATLQLRLRATACGSGGGMVLISAPQPVSPQLRRKATTRSDRTSPVAVHCAAAAAVPQPKPEGLAVKTKHFQERDAGPKLRSRPTTRTNPHMVRDFVVSMTKETQMQERRTDS